MTTHCTNARSRTSQRETGLIQRVRASLRRGFGRDVTPRVLIACSGGRDSIVLADLLGILARTGEIDVEMVHVDHAVRDDSDLAVGLTEGFAAELGMRFHLRRLEQGISGRHPGVGLEEAMRRERYQALADVAKAVRADAVAVAHHQQDQAETVLLHLIRGAGLAGASGMREWSRLTVPWWGDGDVGEPLPIWRPLLNEPLESIAEWHGARHLPLADDHTNIDPVFRRNAIRHEVLPLLEAISAGAVGNLARFAGIAADDDAALDDAAKCAFDGTSGNALPRSVLLASGIAIQRRIIRRWLLEQGYPGELSLERVEAVRELAQRNRSGASVEIGAGWRVQIDRGVLTPIPADRVP